MVVVQKTFIKHLFFSSASLSSVHRLARLLIKEKNIKPMTHYFLFTITYRAQKNQPVPDTADRSVDFNVVVVGRSPQEEVVAAGSFSSGWAAV